MHSNFLKRSVFFGVVFSLSFFVTCFSQPYRFTLEVQLDTGEINELSISEAFWRTLTPYHAATFSNEQSVRKNNSFKFEGFLLYPTAVRLSSDVDSHHLNLFLFVDTGFQSARIIKTPRGYSLQSSSAPEKEYHLFLNSVKATGIDDTINGSGFLQYIKMNPGSYVGFYALLNQAFRYPYSPEFEKASQCFNKKIKNTRAFHYFKELYRPNTVGAAAPDFKVEDSKGQIISLSSYRDSNQVILYFWASWCVYCRELTPYLKTLVSNGKYAGLKVIAISVDTDSVAWRNAIGDEVPASWVHIRSPNFFDQPDNKIRLDVKYSILSYPTVVVVNRSGVIVGRFTDAEGVKMEQEMEKVIARREY